jgi:LuxR family transcriptional regulator, maltose regulon positive regulatory protein
MTASRSSRVLQTLVLPPRPPARCLPRVELVERLVSALQDRLAVVLAGAGYGKTTLLAQAADADIRPWLWLSCDERIDGDRSLLAHVAAAFQRRFPGVGSGLSFTGTAAENVATICNEVVDTVPDELVFAVDDVHLLPPPAADALHMLISDLPPQVHLVLAGRTALPFPVARMRARDTLELGERALALDVGETVALLAMLDPGSDERSACELHGRMEGWVSGLILAARSRAPHNSDPRIRDEDLFGYLAEEVLAARPERVRRFLVQSSVVDRFTPEIAAAITGEVDSRGIISTLLDAHLFTQRLDTDGEWYRYHPVFRAFLRGAATRSAPGPVELHRRAAAAWQNAGEPVTAVQHYLAAGDRARAAEALEPVAEQLVTGPGGELVAAWLADIGAELWSRRPALVLADASLQFTHGEHAAGVAALERATAQLMAGGEHDRAAVAYFRLVQAVTWAGAARDRCIELGERALRRLDPRTDMLPAAQIMLAGAYGHVGRYADADRELAEALDRPGLRRFPVFGVYAAINRAYFLDFRRGHVDAAARDLDAAIAELDARGSEDVLVYQSWARSYRGVLLGYLGRWTEALDVVHGWSGLAVQQGFGRLTEHVSTWHRLAHLAGLGRWSELEAELRRAAPLAARYPETTYAYRYGCASAQLAAHRGDRDAAAREIQSAREAAHAPFPRAMVLADLALVASRVGFADMSAELADAARTAARSVNAPWPLARACLIGAAVSGGDEHGDVLLAEALEVTARWGFQELWSRRERPLAAGLLARALARGLGPAGVAARTAAACGGEVLREAAQLLASGPAGARRALIEAADDAGAVVDPALLDFFGRDPDPGVRRVAERTRARLAERPRAPVRVVSLGAFIVQRPGALPELAFTRRKARTLLAALLAAAGPVHRDVLLEWLWPQLVPERAVAALHTTLHALRQSLQTGLGPRAGDLILAAGNRYSLALEPADEWDAAEFLVLSRALAREPPASRLAPALTAEARYTGPFLPEWRYEQWQRAYGDEVERAYRGVLETVAEELVAAGRPGAAIGRYERLLEFEPEREGWHRCLMRVYARSGERALALRQYHACRTLLRDSLGVDPSPETQRLYVSLL